MFTSSLIVIAVVALLIGVTGLYVAAEFSAVSARRPRLAHLADEGNTVARYLLSILESPQSLDSYIATCQLGITLASLILGFYGQSQILALLAPQIAKLSASAQIAINSVA